jgi:transposase
MFVRVKTTPNSPRKSVQIVESVRDGDKIKQRIVRYVGIAMDDQELEKLKELAEHIKIKIENDRQPSLFEPGKLAEMAIASKKQKNDADIHVDLKKLQEEQRAIVGIHEIYGQVYQDLGFHSVIPGVRAQNAAQILQHIVMARIANPSSKRAAVINLEHDFGISLNLDQVYRMMDKLDESAIQRMQESAFFSTKDILGGKIDVIFVDATTLYFESFIEDDFKSNGYSKDLKFSQPQVLLALMVTKQGLPIGYQAFPGSTYEGHTLLPLLESVKKKYEIDKVVFVADSGLFSENNLKLLEDAGYDYIVGARIRNLSKHLQQQVLDTSAYFKASTEENDIISLREFDYKNRRLIVSHSTKRARKDKHDRLKAAEKIAKKLKKSKDPAQLISNYGYKKFIKVSGESEIALDEEKLNNEALWDGLHGVITNSKNLNPKELLLQYRGLWQIEESFRITKHDLKVRPIFHWTPERIKAHIAICFMAFSCIRHLEYRVHLQYKKLSPEAIRSTLTRVQISVLKESNGNRYVLPSQASQDARKIYQVMGKSYSTQPYRL